MESPQCNKSSFIVDWYPVSRGGNQSNYTDYASEDCSTTAVAGATIVSPLIMFIIGVVGNVIAICTLQISKKTARTSKFYILISGLAWTDLLGIVLTTPSVISAYINGRKWVGGDAHCFYQGFAMTCAGLSTTLIICAISIERFLALKCVFFYSSRCSHGTTRCVIAAVWICVIWFGVLPMFGFGRYQLQYPGTWCFLDFHSRDAVVNTYAYIYASFNLLLVLIMIMCNGYVVYTLHTLRTRKEFQFDEGKRDSLLTSQQQTDWTTGGYRTVRKKHHTVDTQMIVLMCAITSTFVLCWAPLMIQIIVTIATNKPNYLWDLTAIRLASLNQLLDPWLYILLRKSLFEKIKGSCGKVWRKLCCCCDRDHVTKAEEMVNILAVEMKQESINNVNELERQCGDITYDIDKNIPDVSKVNPNTGKSLSPLPDVTNIGQAIASTSNNNGDIESSFNNINTTENRKREFVCRFEIGNGEKNTDIGSVYIKLLFLNEDCCDQNRNDRKCPRLKVTRATPCLPEISMDTSIDNENNTGALDLSPHNLHPVLTTPPLSASILEYKSQASTYDINLRRTKSNS